MTKKANLTSVTNTSNNTVAINANFERLNAKLENTLSLDGSTPNAMNADLDMNTNDILNVKNLWVKGDLIVDGVGSLLDTISGDRQTFDTQADLKAALSLVMGNTYATRGHTTVGDYGGNLYLIREDDVGDGSCVALTGIAGFAQGLFPGNIIRAEQFGCVLGDEGELAERSAEWNAAFAFAASRAAVYSDDDGQSTETDPVGATFTCYTHFKTKDILAMTKNGLHTGARVDYMTVDWRGFVIAVPGGFLETHTQTRPIPMVFVKLGRSTINWPSLYPSHLCAGVKCKTDIANQHYGLKLTGFSRYGLWKVANNDSPYSTMVIKQFIRDVNNIENGVDTSDLSEWNGDCIVASTKDFLMDKVQVGWGGPCVRLLDTKPDDAARNVPGQNCYWCGLESAQGYVDGDNGTGDCFFNDIHMMQGLSGNTDFITAGSGSRTGYYADYDFSTGGMIIRQVDTPIGILSFCKVSNSSFFSRLDNDKCNHYLFGAQVSISDESPNSASTPRCSSTEDTDILDPRIRVFASRGGNGFQRYPFMFSMYDQRNMTVGFYDNPTEIYWDGAALVEASTSWNGVWDKWNQLNTAHGTSYSGPVNWRGSLAAGTYSPSVTAAGDYWVAKGALTINPGGVSVSDGQILYALVASPAGSGDWLVVNVDAAPVRSPNSFVSEITSQRIKVYTTAVNSLLPQETTYVAADFFKHDYFVNGTKTSAIRGFGLPEGAVTAEPGSVYFDLTNKHLWTKATGTSNTGWETSNKVDARAFGVVADGITDDTVAVQAAVTFGKTKSKTVLFPEGEIRITSEINAWAGRTNVVALEGFGKQRTKFLLDFTDPTKSGINLNNGLTIPVNARLNRSIKGIGFFIHPNSQAAAVHPVYLNIGSTFNCEISDVYFDTSKNTHVTGVASANLKMWDFNSWEGGCPFPFLDTTDITVAGTSGTNTLTLTGGTTTASMIGKTVRVAGIEQYTVTNNPTGTTLTVSPNLVSAHTASSINFSPAVLTGTAASDTLSADCDCFTADHIGIVIWISNGTGTGKTLRTTIIDVPSANTIQVADVLGANITKEEFGNAVFELFETPTQEANDVLLSNGQIAHYSGTAIVFRNSVNVSMKDVKIHGSGKPRDYSGSYMWLEWADIDFYGDFGQGNFTPWRIHIFDQVARDARFMLKSTDAKNGIIFKIEPFSGNGLVYPLHVSLTSLTPLNMTSDANSPSVIRLPALNYQEGSWTPVITDGTNNAVAYTVQIGRFVRVGKLVHIQCHVRPSNIGSVTGAIKLAGLPFTSDATTFNHSSVYVGRAEQLAITAGQNIVGNIEPNGTSITLGIFDSAAGASLMTAEQLSPDGRLILSGSYIAKT